MIPGLLPLLLALILPPRCEPVYHSTWSVSLLPYADPRGVAKDLGFDHLGAIGALPNLHLFSHPTHPRRSKSHAKAVTRNMLRHDHVIDATQQEILSRKPRNASEEPPTKIGYKEEDIVFNDPLFSKQWYLFHDRNNVTGAWMQGSTGSGVVVSILDDGLEHTHPDIQPNYAPLASRDLNDHDSDPKPRYEVTNENKHGTRCAGEVAAAANNVNCGVGVAFQAKIGGIRMLDGVVTDAVEASALGWMSNYIDIYSSSWGPDDDGRTVDGPGYSTIATFKRGVESGRKGLGSIFVWASGNGGTYSDNCNCDGYTNSIWTLSIGSVSETGTQPWYSEVCSSTLAVTYSSGSSKEKQIMTTDLHGKCTERHTGTSASAPLAAGIFALVLQAYPLLTWRDVQHLVVRTSKRVGEYPGDWAKNSAGFYISHRFGYGVLNAGALVELARLWNNVPEKFICEGDKKEESRAVAAGTTETFVIKSSGCDKVLFLEHVQCEVTIEAKKRGDIVLQLTSPTGTRSDLLSPRDRDSGSRGFVAWPFMTVHSWGENPTGLWSLSVKNNGDKTMTLISWRLVLHGTSSLPSLRNSSRDMPDSGNLSFVTDVLFRGSRNSASSLPWIFISIPTMLNLFL